MKLVLVAINAQYIHTGLAVRQLAAVLKAAGVPGCTVAEYTINQRAEDILEDLALQRADGYLFSCYIWNIALIASVAASLRKVCPGAHLVAGGPQVAFCAQNFLRQNPAFHAVSTGEGEAGIVSLARAVAGEGAWDACPNIVYRGTAGALLATPNAPPPALDSLPFAYQDLDGLHGRIVYYESMRGCPYRCSYCLSGGDGGVRYKSLDKVYRELDRFLAAGVHQVKLVDRTFNCNAGRALAIWRYLAGRDNGKTGFHFEIVGHLLNPQALAFLKGVRPGLFQFEIGVQSANQKTLQKIHREKGLEETLKNARILWQAGNVHLHLDLIAGLPEEDFDSFAHSFNTVYAQRPHQMQLGFLKVLSGSEMERRAPEYGLVWQDAAPFEILYNKWLSFEELCRLKGVAQMVELYHNSGRFDYLIAHLCARWRTPFGFYSLLSAFYRQRGCHAAPLSKLGQYQLLGDFARAHSHGPTEEAQWLCRLDMARHEKPRTMPAWVGVDGSHPHRDRVLDFYRRKENIRQYLPAHQGRQAKQLLKMAHVEVLPFDPQTGRPGECAFLFDYSCRDITGKAHCAQIQLPEE